MIKLNRNFLIVLMITVSFVILVHANPPPQKNDDFKNCVAQMGEIFLNTKLEPLECIRIAIINFSLNEETYHNVQKYYLTFSGKVNSSSIINQNEFCAEMVKGFKSKKEKNQKNKGCTTELAIFGSNNDEILEKALYEHKLTNDTSILDTRYNHKPFTLGYFYLSKISEQVELKPNVKNPLQNPWRYCYNTYPDKNEKIVELKDQASSSSKEDLRNVKTPASGDTQNIIISGTKDTKEAKELKHSPH